jgi:hypothetical protein
MIEVLGEPGTPEHEVAMALSEALVRLWPDIAETPDTEDDIKIAASVKISGYPVSDIDVVACGLLRPGRRIVARRPFRDTRGDRVIGKPIEIQNFVVAIEVKDHESRSVQVTADDVSVKYSRGGPPRWKSATEQNVKQLHALQAYLEDFGASLFVHRCLVMRGLEEINAKGALPRNFKAEDLFFEVGTISGVRKLGPSYVISSGDRPKIERALQAPIFRPIVPSSLDRKRMDRIASRSERIDALLPVIGNGMLEFRGHGGTGKTVMLLQLAWQKFQKQGERTLVLTYNHALAADIRRLLSLLGIPSSPENGGITVDTVMSFMFTWFSRLQLLEETDLDFDKYGALCADALEMLRAGAIGSEDVSKIVSADPDRFDFDVVVVDEAQDWPENEVALLKALYGHKRLALADGIDQLVRGKRARWDKDVPKEERKVEPLDRCLRMKSNLAVFANLLAEDAGLGWTLVPNDEAGGGRVIVLNGNYADFPHLHDQLLDQARESGNAEIDFLFCVPPTGVNEADGKRTSELSKQLASRGFETWDGVDERTRRDFPRSCETYRIVQFASSRGLEGWVVVLEGLDEFWNNTYQARIERGLDEDSLESIEVAATREAWRWALIPLTRPIDTLVISISDPTSPLAEAIARAQEKRPDIIEFYELDEHAR